MKRLLLILLLTIVPFQMSWAMVASYCQHEQQVLSKSDPQHVGHHDHAVPEHHAEISKTERKSVDVIDAECDFSHFSCGKLVSSFQYNGAVPSVPDTFGLSVSPRYRSHIADTPEEPDWSFAA